MTLLPQTPPDAAQVELAIAALDASSNGLALVRDGRIVACNARFQELTGLEGAGAALTDPWPRLPRLTDRIGRLASRAAGEFRADVHDAGGAAVSVHIRLRPAGDGRLLLSVREITAQRRRTEELTRLATHDPLTGLPNRRMCTERLVHEIARTRRHDRPLCLAVLDIDHFKRINDTYGHPTGDRVLEGAARRLSAMIRPDDVLARIGGEEFAWVLPEVDVAGALAAADRARAALAAEPFADGIHVTATVGICSLGEGDDAAALYDHADRALYWGKAGGRDATLVWTPEADARLRGGLDRHRAFAVADLVDAVAGDRHGRTVADVALAMAAARDWAPDRQARLHRAARLHDVGKAAMPDELVAPGRALTPVEAALLRRHPVLGAELAAAALDVEQAAWVRHHHERWDGAGHPGRLRGDAIPDGAQLIAIADAYVRAGGEDAAAAVARLAGAQLRPDGVAMLRAGLEWREGTGAAAP